MDNPQHYDPNAPVSRFSSRLRFRPFNPDAKSAAKANKNISASPEAKRTTSVSEIGEGEELPNQTTAVEETTSLPLQESKIDRPGVNNRAETPAMTTDGHTYPHDGSNDLDSVDNESDGHDSLRSLFSPAELDRDSSETDLGVDAEQEGSHKRLSEDAVRTAERSRAGDSADMPLVLEGDSSAVELNGFAGPLNPESEPERHLGFDEMIPVSLALPDASGRVESEDGSDSDTTNPYRFASRKRKPGPEVGGVRSNASLSSSHPQAMGLTSPRRIANDTSDLASKRKRRRRSVSSSSSSSSDESQRNSGLVASPENMAGALSQSARRRRQRRSSEDLSSEEEGSRDHDDLASADQATRPDLGTPRAPPKFQEKKGMARSNPDDAHIGAKDGEDGSQDEIVWKHGRLLRYKVVNGKPLVLVPWRPTWEPPDEYPEEEVERVKRQYKSGTLGKRRRRLPLSGRW